MPKKLNLKTLQLMPPNPEVSLDTAIDRLYEDSQFGTRTLHALKTLNCKNTRDILTLDPANLHCIPHIGAQTVAEVMAFMLRYRSLLDAYNAAHELSTFDSAKNIISAGLMRLSDDLLALSKDLPSAIRVMIDFRPNEEPRVAFDEVADSEACCSSFNDDEESEEAPRRKKRKVLEIITPEGEVWSEKFAYLTFMRFIEEVGIEKVAAMNIEAKPDIPLVSKLKYDPASSKASKGGWFIFTGIANTEKARIVKTIAEHLNLAYTARTYTEIIE